MADSKINKNNRLTVLALSALAGWLFLVFLHITTPMDIYFENSLVQDKLWFPHLYLPFFIVCRLCFPFIYGVLLFYILSSQRLDHYLVLLLIVAQTILLFFMELYYSMNLLIGYIMLPVAVVMVLAFGKKITEFIRPLLYRILLSPAVSGSIFFLLYIILCIVLPRNHPFAGYTMFDRFGPATHVYQLRDTRGALIPLRSYTFFMDDELMSIGNAIKNKYRSHGPVAQNDDPDKAISSELMNQVFNNIKLGNTRKDSVQLYLITFMYKDNKPVKYENILGTFKAY